MATDYSVICKLGGYVNSNPELISSYPSLDQSLKTEILPKCFPIGAKTGDFIVEKYRKYVVLSYIFRVNQTADRDDIFSLSVLLNKKDKTEIYKPVLQSLIDKLEQNDLLNEHVLTKNQRAIFEGMNQEKNVTISNVLIDLSKVFKEIKSKILKPEIKVKGSFL
ncbi:MAG: hypothetical protein KGD68_00780 [Candidatus Lokiarchaeota archaeon]|nr:hypothetical protein [Candidatus Lokiarchaeota archaeon]